VAKELVKSLDNSNDETLDAKNCQLQGEILLKEAHCEAALRCFDRAIELDPKNPKYHTSRAVALYRLDRFSDALAGYARALELDPTRTATWFVQALAFA